MSAPKKVASLTLGGTNIYGQVGGVLEDRPGLPPATFWFSQERVLPTTKAPNDPTEDFRRICRILNALRDECGFNAIVVAVAAQVDENGVLSPSGNLGPWSGLNLTEMLSEAFPGIPILVENDGAMFFSIEALEGVLRMDEYKNLSGMGIGPGTGLAVYGFVYNPKTGLYTVDPGEGAHVVIDKTHPLPPPEERCGCKKYCVESMASGRVLEQLASKRGFVTSDGKPDVGQFDDNEVEALLAPPLGTLVANVAQHQPRKTKVLVVSGAIPFKRPGLTAAIAREVRGQLDGYVATPKVVRGKFPDGGLRGGLAYEWLVDRNMLATTVN